MTPEATTLIVPGAEILPDSETLDGLLKSGRRLRVKVGIDPTTSSMHWGHALCLLQAAAFQRSGHEVMLLIGTFTATVGDPSGRSAARPQLSPETARKHSEHLVRQALRILHPDCIRVVRNHEWLSSYPLSSLLADLSAFTVPQVLARQSFRDRLNETHPLGMNELLYPFLQALDSAHLGADVEIGGRDQVPNFALTRRLQKARGQDPEIGCTLPLLPGTDGAEKMSASDGNSIDLESTPDDTFGRVMSIPDAALPGFTPLARLLSEELEADDWPDSLHPMDAKAELARRMITRTHDETTARKAEEAFNVRFRQREIPDDVPERRLAVTDSPMTLFLALVKTGMASSRSEARRLVQQGAIRIDGEKAFDPLVRLDTGEAVVLSRGRRQHVRVQIEAREAKARGNSDVEIPRA
jgi:tyrosyl-tRNA synthetase